MQMVQRGSTWRLTLPLAVAFAVLGGACGDDDAGTVASGSDQTPTSASATQDADQQLREYCNLSESYLDSTENVDTTNAQSILAGFAASAEAARAAADAAPPEIREASDTLAKAGLALSTALQERNPQTMDELEQANAEVAAELEAEFGTLEPETQQVQRFDEENCGLSFDE